MADTALLLKLWGWLPPRNLRIRCRIHEPHITLEPIDRHGHVAVVEGRDVRLLTAKGDVVAVRKDAWGRMAAGEVSWRWDAMALAYFLGQAARRVAVVRRFGASAPLRQKSLSPSGLGSVTLSVAEIAGSPLRHEGFSNLRNLYRR